ncbi:MAG TPA: hypothetical protein VMF30_07690, partial [Pirellulales bacterium]|nr:hypothetical protein [Pirellulales bacterium]
ISPGAHDTSAETFQIYGITGGTLYSSTSTTPLANNTYITVAVAEIGLVFLPNQNSLVPGGFTVRESATTGAIGLSGPAVRDTVTVTLAGPTVTAGITAENTQSAGLLVNPGTRDTSAAFFHIYGINGGTLYQSDGTTPIANNSYITVAQGEAGLKFTPNTNSLAAGGYTVQESTTDSASGLNGPVVRGTVAVSLAGPSVTNETENENTNASNLVIYRGLNDASAAYFQIYGITGGTLYQNNGTTPIPNNSYITVAQGEAGLVFKPNTNSLAAGGYTVRESTTNGPSGLNGPTARGAINVILSGPFVTSTTTEENRQTTTGLVISPGTHDSTAYFFISGPPEGTATPGILNGTLYLSDGTTPVPSNSFITVAQGEAGLKFTPEFDSTAAGIFTVEEAATNTFSGISGPIKDAYITVFPSGTGIQLGGGTPLTTPSVAPANLALAVQETANSPATTTNTASNVIPAANNSALATPAAGTPSTAASSPAASGSTSSSSQARNLLAAKDEAVADFDLTDLLV